MMNEDFTKRLTDGSIFREASTPLVSNPNWRLHNSSWTQMSINNAMYLLEAMKSILERWLGYEYVNSKKLLLVNHASYGDIPECWWRYGIISLGINGEYWCQFIYQLSHELFHLMMYETPGTTIPNEMMWLSEIICETSSFCMLSILAKQWLQAPIIPNCDNYAKSIEVYYDDLMRPVPQLSDRELVLHFLQNIDYLRRCPDDRCLNKIFSKRLHSMFIVNENLWITFLFLCKTGINKSMSTEEMLNAWYQSSPDDLKSAVKLVLMVYGFTETAGNIKHNQTLDSGF
jgi:hypothetical protein